MTKEDIDNKAEAFSIRNDVPEMDELRGDMDNLVEDLSKEWQTNVAQKNSFFNVDIGTQLDAQEHKANATYVSSAQHSNSNGKLFDVNYASVCSKQQGVNHGKQHFFVHSASVFSEQQGNFYGKQCNVVTGPDFLEHQGNKSGHKHAVSTQELVSEGKLNGTKKCNCCGGSD